MSKSAERTTQSERHEVVILGGHFAGVSAAHYILRHVFPTLIKSFPTTTPHVTLVAPHTHFFWNIAAPRYLCARDVIDASKIFISLDKAFEAYPSEQYTILQGNAKRVDPATSKVEVSLVDGTTANLDYASLVVATGRKSNSPLWQINDSGDKTKLEFAKIQDRLQTARSAIIAGGGPIGVETAGEIASRHQNIDVRLYSGTDRVLPRLLPSTSATAEKRLQDLGVRVIHGQRYTGVEEGEQSVVSFGKNSTEVTDVFIDATGGRPNSSFLPTDWTNGKGFVRTNEKTTRVEGANSDGVYALGDVASYSDGTLNGVFRAVPAMGSALGTDAARRLGGQAAFPVRHYSPMVGTQLVPTGPKGGVGQLFGWRIFSSMVWAIKSRAFFVDNAPGIVIGNGFRKP
ncbi:hypothetical protein EKO04_010544 [Ascochyta lentis]|uniref:FAD/NAD(P)-binding domain-containing protein n=1 Tax=Ascochyta lentis TaxID=205686 RepID=A0A8H7MBN9_9PLEO|nr:hypothetical protein EKO04_010544 [Ascochyta lentis]